MVEQRAGRIPAGTVRRDVRLVQRNGHLYVCATTGTLRIPAQPPLNEGEMDAVPFASLPSRRAEALRERGLAHRGPDGRAHLPACAVYLPYRFPRGHHFWFEPVSTRLAAGACPQHAVFAGLMEAVERDSSVVFRENRLTLPSLDFDRLPEGRARTIVERLGARGIPATGKDPTTDLGIPALGVRLREGTPERPVVVHSARADLDPHAALLGALEEACPRGRRRVAGAPRHRRPPPVRRRTTGLPPRLHPLLPAPRPPTAPRLPGRGTAAPTAGAVSVGGARRRRRPGRRPARRADTRR
ncbi:YcaO-like family protein [Streptomyces sulphureus]|uniref:YcaO-like family protein n=1 Tax=Streptomyces sulphureus TaxID=47758 RepID=UPI0003AB1A43|nr:YcaO-like family protein [Streptomyces sulphureus]